MTEDLVLGVDFNITKAEAKTNKLKREFENSKRKEEEIKNTIKDLTEQLETEKAKQTEIREIIKEQVKEADELARKIEKVESGNATIEEVIDLSNIDTAKAKLAEMESEIQKNERQLEKTYNSQKKTTSEIQKQNNALARQNGQTATIGENIAVSTKKTNKFKEAFEKSGKTAKDFIKHLKTLATRVLLFSVITSALRKLKETFSDMITEQGTKTAELAAKLKGGLSVIGTTLYESAKPAIEWILNALVKMVKILATGLAKILGKDINEMKKLAQQTKKTGEEAKKATAGFDTLQTIDTSSNSSSSSDSGTDTSGIGGDLEGQLVALMAVVAGALLVIGCILAFTGVNIPLGIGLMIAGAALLATAVVPNWDSMSNTMKGVIIGLLAVVSVALLVIGCILAFSGNPLNLPLGIALIALGAVGLATAATLAFNMLPEKIKPVIAAIAVVLAGALMVLGIILMATGAALPLGLGLLVAGAALMAGAITAMWKTLPNKTKDVISWIMAIGGLLMLVIGIILCATGANIPLGIALIAIGAAALVGSIALNWNAITDKVKKIASSIGDIFKKCWNGIKTGFKSMVNGIISLANLWIKGLNLLLTPVRGLIYGIAKAFGSDVKFDDIAIPTIPKLATGAVLPGGSPMLAWVNDQPKGQGYIEGSIDNIATAFEKYLGNHDFGGKQNVTIEAKGNWAQFIKWMNLQIKQENDRATIYS